MAPVAARSVADICRAAKAAARQLARLDSAAKDRVLLVEGEGQVRC